MNMALAKLLKKMKIPLEAAGGHSSKLNRVAESSSKIAEEIAFNNMKQNAFNQGLLKSPPDTKRIGDLVDRSVALKKMEKRLLEGSKKAVKGVNAASLGLAMGIPTAYLLSQLGDEQ